MARLNEAPSCATESVDALKRRFMKSNRDLAKTNSIQSVRIRCLEAEVSRLLTENLGLRNDILQLRNDLDGVETKRAFNGVKSKLQAQVDELAKLVAAIGRSEEQKDSDAPAIRSFPTVGWGRGMGDPMDGTDGRLPAIKEDKTYPRRTLDAQDIQAIADSESPAIGSPPVSHFQDEEPIKYEQSPAPTETKTETEDPVTLPANLETRRKKRDSSTRLSIRRMSVFSSPEDDTKENVPESEASTQVLPIRAGAKRKLGSMDGDGKGPTDFSFSRKTGNSSEPADVSGTKEENGKEPVKTFSRRDPARAMPSKLSERKALGEKSINTDPVVSPQKTVRKGGSEEQKESLKKPLKATEDAPRPRTIRDRRSRAGTDEYIPIMAPTDSIRAPTTREIVHPDSKLETAAKLDLPPKTPAASMEVLSAPSTESSARPTGRDTPPPGDLSASTDNNGRPGRRARASVNYAEPSLNAKMRRPTKELLDAVGRDGRVQKGMIVVKNKEGVDTIIKVEDVSDSAWKRLPSTASATVSSNGVKGEEPTSPLGQKGVGLKGDNNALKIMHAEPEPLLPSAASQAIAALIKDSRATAVRRRSSAVAMAGKSATGSDSETKERRGSSIYDFASSSPPRSTVRPSSRSSDRESDDGTKMKHRTTTSRRHSSVPSLAGQASIVGKESRTINSTTRPSSRLGGGGVGGGGGTGHKRTISGTAVDAPVSAADAGNADLRASRRRSMML